MIRRFYEAKEAGIKEVTIWEVVNLVANLYVDLAKGVLFLLTLKDPQIGLI